MVEVNKAVPSKIIETVTGRCPRNASSHSNKWASLARRSFNPKGNVILANLSKRRLILVA